MTGKKYENLIGCSALDEIYGESPVSEYLMCKNAFVLIRVNSSLILDPLFSDDGRHCYID